MNYVFKNILFFSFLVTFGLQSGLSMATPTSSIPFIKSHGLIIINASINGQNGAFIFDSGCNSLIVHAQNFNSEVAATFETVNGSIDMQEIEIADFRVGGFEAKNVEAYAQDLSLLSARTGVDLSGIVGVHLFENQIVHIDNESHVIELYKDLNQVNNLSAYSVESTFTIKEGLVFVPIVIDHQVYQFLLDTGSSASFINKELISNQTITSMHPLKKEVESFSLSNESSVSTVYLFQKVGLSNIQITDLEMGAIDLSLVNQELGFKVDGILSIEQIPVSNMLIDIASKKLYLRL